jgi:hypothetical protein
MTKPLVGESVNAGEDGQSVQQIAVEQLGRAARNLGQEVEKPAAAETGRARREAGDATD